VPVKDMDRGVLEVTNRDGKKFFLKNVGPWMFVGPKAEMLAGVTADPIRLLDGLDRRYGAAVRIYPACIPQSLREKFLEALNQRAQIDLAQKPGEKDEEYAGRRLGMRWALNAFSAAVNEMEHISLGLMLDAKAGKALVDLETVARAGTKAADRFARWAQLQTAFGGFTLPGAAITAHWTGWYSKQIANDLTELLLSPAEKAALAATARTNAKAEVAEEVKNLMKRWVNMHKENIDTGRMDGGAAIVLDSEGVTVIAGQEVADGPKIERLLSDIVEAGRRHDPVVTARLLIKKDADKCGTVRLHALSIPIGPDAKHREQLIRLFGEKLQIALGFSDKGAYFAMGREPVKALKDAIQKSQNPGPKRDSMIQLAVAAGPLAKFVSNIVGNPQQSQKAAELADLLEEGGGTGRIQLTAGPIAGGAKLRIEVDDGILKAAVKLRRRG
jgi:hypothetical protein